MAEIEKLGQDRLATVNLSFRGTFSGMVELVFPEKDASTLITALTGEDPVAEDLDALRAGALCEVGNVVLNSVMGAISNMLKLSFTYSVPVFADGASTDLWTNKGISKDTVLLFARTFFEIEKYQIEGSIVVFLQIGALDRLLSAVDAYVESMSEGV
jgi:chemotaxis protein CheC